MKDKDGKCCEHQSFSKWKVRSHVLVLLAAGGGNSSDIFDDIYNDYGDIPIFMEKSRRLYLFLTKSSQKNAVKYLLECCYFQVVFKILRQDVRIPVGSGLAPFISTYFFIILRTDKSEKSGEKISDVLDSLPLCFVLLMTGHA